jgi:hypothetical protein
MRWLLVGAVMVSFVPVSGAAELDNAPLRGSRTWETARTSTDYAADYPIARLPAKGPFVEPPPVFGMTVEVGARYWYASGKLSKNLFDDPRFSPDMLSRLTYDGLTAGSFEAFGRWDNAYGLMVKGYAGFTNLGKGTLADEDFFPDPTLYSKTLSQQHSGHLDYASVDIGQNFQTSANTSFAIFAGYGYLIEKTSGFGCSQLAGNPFICIPSIPTNVLGITESTTWQFARIGVLGEYRYNDRLKVTAEVAWVPYAVLRGNDVHWLRLGTSLFDISGPIPENGTGAGVQVEAIVSYQVFDNFNVGIGGRYWNLHTTGAADFESVIVGFPLFMPPAPQPLTFSTIRYGGFVQASYKFGPF